MKQKVRNQAARVVEGGPDYHGYIEREEGGPESIQANPNSLTEAAGYWYVDETTKEIQGKVRLMLEKAKQVLTVQQYNAFVLVDLKKLKLREAAKVLETNHQRVDQLVKRARLKLQAVYSALD